MDKKIAKNIPLFLLIIVGFFYRICGLGANHSFWTDENHVAIFARAILERGAPVLANGFHTGTYQWLLYWLGAISARIFGLNEFAIRFPSVIFGVLTIWAVWLLGRELFVNSVVSPSEESIPAYAEASAGGRPPRRRDLALPPFEVFVPLVAAVFITFLRIEILWSRQARPYQALQFFFVLGAWFVYRLTKEEKFNWRYFLGFLGCGVLASLFHGLGLVIFFNGFLLLLITNFKTFKKWLFVALPLLGILGYSFRVQLLSLLPGFGKINNFFYYRVFLTHNYLPLTLLAGSGGLFLLMKAISHSKFILESQHKKILNPQSSDGAGQVQGLPRIHFGDDGEEPVQSLSQAHFSNDHTQGYAKLLLFALFLGTQMFIVSFLLGQPFTRYFYPVFPFIILLASYGLTLMAEITNHKIQKSNKLQITKSKNQINWASVFIFLLLFLLLSRNKFSFLPHPIYSLNADMQEIPEVDWKKIYQFVGQKLTENPQAILVTNWNDLPVWYLGENIESLYIAREKWDQSHEIDPVSGGKMIYSLEDLDKLVKGNLAGMAIFDSWDNLILKEAGEYAQKNLKKEMEIDRLYPIQPRYWPVNVYSWGME